MRNLSFCLLSTFVLLAGPPAFLAGPPAFAEDWGQWRGPHRDGAARDCPTLIDALPESGLKPVWIRRDIESARSGGWSSPVVSDGRVFLFTHRRVKVGEGELGPRKYPWLPPEKRNMTDEEYEEYERNRRDEEEARSKFYRFDELVYCVDAETGEDIWTAEKKSVYTRFAQSGSPAIADGRLYILGAGRMARCLSAADGSTVWEQRLPGEFRDEYMQSSFLVHDGVAVVLAKQLFALDAGSGKLLWASDADRTQGSHSSPVLWTRDGTDHVIVNAGGGQTACFALQDGAERWRVRSDASHSTPLVVGDKMLTFGSSRKAGLRCFDLSQQPPAELWSCHELADKGSSPVVLDGHVYVQGERKLACVDLRTGEARWTATMEMSRPQYTSLVGADGKLMYTYDGLLMFAASPDEYQLLSQAKIDKQGLLADESVFRELHGMDELEKTSEGRKEALQKWQGMFRGNGPLACSSPALSGGRLFVRLEKGLVCYDLRQDSPESP